MTVQLWSEVKPELQEPGELCGLAVGFTACASSAAGRVGTAPAPGLGGTRSSVRKGTALGVHQEQLIPLFRYQCCGSA